MRLAAVYSREIDGQVLTLGASGWTYKSTFVLWDRETESMWYHLEGEHALTCISGPLHDNKLPEFGSVVGRWSFWHENYPDTEFLKYP